MRATVITGPGSIEVHDVPDPRIEHPTDAVIRTVATCICGSDLWHYRMDAVQGETRRIGHEVVGIVEEIGSDVSTVSPGQFVISPFAMSCGACPNCTAGFTANCTGGGGWWAGDVTDDACQGEAVRIAMADGTLVATPEVPDDDMVPALLTLSDVMGTGWHAAISAGVSTGSTVVVVGDGAVGQCAVIAARVLGAQRIIVMSRRPSRQALARELGATDIVETRGHEGSEAIWELTDGRGADYALECVGTNEAFQQATHAVHVGGGVGYVGVPHDIDLNVAHLFRRNVRVSGGLAPARAYLPQLLNLVTTEQIQPGKVFDHTVALDDIASGYRAMDQRESIKTLVLP